MTAEHETILIIDDDTVFTEVLSRGLRRRGFDPCCTQDAAQALQTCRRLRPRFILLDLNMPGTSGLLILPRLLALAPDTRLVVLTGYSSIATAVQAMRAGAADYLCKPAGIDEILRAFDVKSAPAAAVPPQPTSVRRLEWEHIQRVLGEHDGNISATARALGMHRRTLQRKLQKKPVAR